MTSSHSKIREYEKFTQDRDELIAIWDVSHTTGSDIRVSKVAHAIIIVGKHLKLYEFAQAAFRLRDLGPSGQRLEIFIPINDRDAMIEKMNTRLGYNITAGTDLTVDQVIQYALLNELLQETENNYRAADQRLKCALMGPASVSEIRGETLPTENLLEDTDGLLRPPFSLEGRNNPQCPLDGVSSCSRFLLTCALLMTSSRIKRS